MRAVFLFISFLFPSIVSAEAFVNYTHDPLGLYMEATERDNLDIEAGAEVLYWVVLIDQAQLLTNDFDPALQVCYVPLVPGTDSTLPVPWYNFEWNGDSMEAKKLVVETNNILHFYTLQEIDELALSICLA